MSDDFIVTIEDVRSSGHCVRGAKDWFEGYGLDFREFIKTGMVASRLLSTGDAYAQQVVEHARNRVGADHGR